MNIVPIEFGVIIKPTGGPEQTKSGVYSVGSKSLGMRKGKIHSLGGKVEKLSVGMEIFYHANVGTEITVEGVKYVFLEYRDVKGYYE